MIHFFENPDKPRYGTYDTFFTLQNDSTVRCCVLCECLSTCFAVAHISNAAPHPASISKKVRFHRYASSTYTPPPIESPAEGTSSGELCDRPNLIRMTYMFNATVDYDEDQSETQTSVYVTLKFADKDCQYVLCNVQL